MTVRFNLAPHSVVQGQMIEVFDDDLFVGAIYPAEHGIRIVSHYLRNDVGGDPSDPPGIWLDVVEPPALNVELKP